jgi:hypothetical protein
MIAEFLQRDLDSNFQLILTNQPEWRGQEKIFASLDIRSSRDKRLQFIAKLMKRNGEIYSWCWHWQSGKLQLTWPNGYVQTFGEPSVLLASVSKTVAEKVKQSSK